MLQENEKILAECRPDFLEEIRGASIDDMSFKDIIRLDQARDGNSVLVIERDEQLYRLNSAFRPVQEADRWVTQFNLDHLENIILMFGLGNGIFLKSLLKALRKDDKIVIYEPSLQIFRFILDREDICSILSDPRVYIVVEGINSADFYFVMERFLNWRNIDALCVCDHPGYKDLYALEYVSFMQQILECKELVHVVKYTDVNLAHQTVRNYFINMRYIAKSNMLADFVGKIPKDFPAIIVSAGPSLDKNIEELKRAQGKAFILAVDSAVNILLSHDIKFDAMISVDAKKVKSHISREECKEVPLICGLMSKPQILAFHQGKKIWVMGSRYIEGLYSEMGHPFLPINIGGSVATAAFAACEKLGFQKIVLVGQDLAYGDGATHAGGVVKSVVNEQSGQKEVDGWGGSKVRSRYDWLIYLSWFESAIQQMPEVQVIDATEGGALIHGSEVMTLSEVIDRYCTIDFSMRDLLDKEPPTFNEETYVKVQKKLQHLEKELENVKRSSEEAVMICDQVIDMIKQHGSGVPLYKQAKRLTALNSSIYSQGVYQLLDYYVTETAVEDLKDINQMTGNKEDDIINTYKSAKAMYDSLVRAVKELNGDGYGFGEEMEKVQKELEEAIVLSVEMIEMIQHNVSDEEIENQKEKVAALGKILNPRPAFVYLAESVADEINNMDYKGDNTGDERQDLLNSYIDNRECCAVYLREAKRLSRAKFVHDCLMFV